MGERGRGEERGGGEGCWDGANAVQVTTKGKTNAHAHMNTHTHETETTYREINEAEAGDLRESFADLRRGVLVSSGNLQCDDGSRCVK